MATRPRRPRRSFLSRLVRWLFAGLLAFVLGSILWVLLYAVVRPPITFTMIGDMLEGHSISYEWTPLERIDRDMVRAVIAAEDSKFCQHGGFDTQAIEEAMRRNARGGSVIRGGSTISQQTAKNAFLWQGGGYFRKGLEAWFTLLIEQIWGKRRIMEVYLNIAETGIGTYGVNAGARRYFGKDAASLSRTEAARIAAILPLPKRREAVAPAGFTRRYGNAIQARIGVVQRDRLDACVYEGVTAPPERPEPARPKARPAPQPKAQQPRAPEPVPGEEYEAPAARQEPTQPQPEPAPERESEPTA